MHILELPTEILDNVLLQAVISRGVVRALRLKLVCKHFNNCVPRALFASKLLDTFRVKKRYHDDHLLKKWQIRKHYGAEKLWHSYLVYRVQNEKDSQVYRFVEIRKIAEELCQQTGDEYGTTVDTLCWLALDYGTWGATMNVSDRPKAPPNPGLNLLSAATYLGHIPLVKRLLSEGHCPIDHNDLFPSPMQLAAWAGHADILQLFQEQLPEFEDYEPRFQRTASPGWRGKTGPGSVKGAALRGDVDLLRLALYPPSRAKPDSDDIVGQTFGHVDAKSKTGQDLSEALFCAKNPEAFEYIQSCLGGSQLQGYGGDILLAKYSELGNVEMVRYLLDAGVPPQNESLNLNSLVIASRFSHDDVVRVLLEHGADPNKWKKQQRGPPLMNAAAAGSMSIARMLIDAGANGSEVSASIMENAVRLEHTAMVELFLDEGICSPKSSARALKRQAKEKGLESMVALLERRGVTSGSSKT